MTTSMSTDLCPKHGCRIIPITDDAGGATVAEDCPRCMDEQFAKAVRALDEPARRYVLGQ